MNFKDLTLSYRYRSDSEDTNIIRDFYIPVLEKTKIYQRAVGYFSSGSLAFASKGIGELIENGGKMQLIASPNLSKEDIEAIERGYIERDKAIEESILKALEIPSNELVKERLNYLAWLIAREQLDIKIAVLKDKNQFGLYHEKLGIMEDYNKNKIAFSGSSNETEGGLYNNFESIDVFCSWQPSEELRVETKVQDFMNLWNNTTNKLDILDFPDAAKEKILTYRKNTFSKKDPEVDLHNTEINQVKEASLEPFPKIPSHFEIRDYQQEAIRAWFRNNCKGLLEMATGTGKTITALSAVSKLWEVTNRLGVVIVCPYTHLVDQWVEDIKQFNMSPVVAYSSRSLWENELSHYVTAFQSGIINHFCLITTNATFGSSHMQAALHRLRGQIVFVADEAHHLGADRNRKKLLDSFPYRLALSATPNRWYDDEGTDELISYFGGKVVFQFGLEKAIERDFLTQYFYYPHVVHLDEDESEKYYEITRKLVRLMPRDGNIKDSGNESLQSLLIERSRILSRARNKIIILRELMEGRKDSKYNIIYCGDSRVDGEKQIDVVVNLLGYELGMKVHTFTSREDEKQRRELLKRFEDGNLQGLVAIKCLDEGVDVPATQTAYILSSSTNPREFIQRRGRVLRKHRLKQYSYIHDFIVVPRPLNEVGHVEDHLFNIERNMIKREMARFTEFADLAINGPKAHEIIDEVKHAYNLLDV